jgi:hypothetical protein
MPNVFKIATTNLTTTTPNVTFSSIPQIYKDLKILVNARGALGQIYDGCSIEFNGVTTGYSFRQFQGNGASVTSTSGSIYPEGIISGSTSTANTFGNAEFYIPNAFGSRQKILSVDSASENNATTAFIRIQSGLWTGTAAISSIKLIATAGSNFVSGSTFTLYGIL